MQKMLCKDCNILRFTFFGYFSEAKHLFVIMITPFACLDARVRRDPGTRPVPNFFSSTRPVPTRKLKMTGYRVIKFHFETNETQPRMKRTANKVKDPINPSTGNHFL